MGKGKDKHLQRQILDPRWVHAGMTIAFGQARHAGVYLAGIHI
jgi:hypothetical protein